MNLYSGTLGQLVIVEAFVFYIWLKVLLDAVKQRDGSLAHKKLLLTSLGLVMNAAAIAGIMAVRIDQLLTNSWPFVWALVPFYVMLAVANFLLIVAASVGSNTRLLKLFFATTAVWTAYILFVSWPLI